MIIVAYYTVGTPYEELAVNGLIPTLKRWKVQWTVKGVHDKGSWIANTSYKPTFIRDMLNKYQESITYVDVDAEIWRNPVLLGKMPRSIDVACHYLDWWLFWKGVPRMGVLELLTGTAYFKHSKKVLGLLDEYVELCEKNPGVWEQKHLQNLLERRTDIKVGNLPAEYCAIIKRDGTIPSYITKPVIVHKQASRQHRK